MSRKKSETTFYNHTVFSKKSPFISSPELEFLKSLWGLGTEKEEGYHTGPPGYIG